MEDLNSRINFYQIRKDSFENRSRKIVVYSKIEETTLSTGPGKALITLIPTVGCSYALNSKSGGCSFCGYPNDSTLDPNTDPSFYFLQEWEKQKDYLNTIEAVKIFNSGSFLDPKEIPFEVQQTIIEKIATLPNVKEVIIESRPEYINLYKVMLKKWVDILGGRPIWIGVGLESSNDYVGQSFVNKGFDFAQFARSVKNAEECGAFVKAYILLKPPFMTEKEAIEDTLQSIIDSFNIGCKIVSINPVTVHAATLVDTLFKKHLYSPPWLWSVLEVLKRAAPYRPDYGKIICEPVAIGKERGAHNCGKCDILVSQEIEYYSLHNEFSPALEHLHCENECQKEWEWIIQNENLLVRHAPIFHHRLRANLIRKNI